MTNRELLAAKICKATQKTNFSCNNNEKCQGTGQCAYCLTMAEDLLANDVMAPPCNVGDKLYKPSIFGEVTELKAKGIIGAISTEPYNLILFSDIGKIVFLTKEEAEVKLEEINHG